jgi:hypothetical protein
MIPKTAQLHELPLIWPGPNQEATPREPLAAYAGEDRPHEPAQLYSLTTSPGGNDGHQKL